jgi:UDP-glucose 4-epimerase
VADAFLARDYRVTVIDELSAGNAENVPSQADFAEVDIVDGDAVKGVFASAQPSVVAHLAAQASVTASVKDPERDLAVNVLGTYNICQAAAHASAPVVFASTGGALYGDRAPVPSPEDAIPEPLAPYGASKLAGEAYVGTWGRLHGVENCVLRLGNVYGPRQSPHGEAGVVAIFSDRLSQGKPPVVYGDGRQTRDYIHVGDVANAFVSAAEGGIAGTFNVGWGVESSVLDLLEHLQREAPVPVAPEFQPPRTGELLRSALNSTRIREALGWEPQVSLAAGLPETYRYYVGRRPPPG